jgi:hypothetical protein
MNDGFFVIEFLFFFSFRLVMSGFNVEAAVVICVGVVAAVFDS